MKPKGNVFTLLILHIHSSCINSQKGTSRQDAFSNGEHRCLHNRMLLINPSIFDQKNNRYNTETTCLFIILHTVSTVNNTNNSLIASPLLTSHGSLIFYSQLYAKETHICHQIMASHKFAMRVIAHLLVSTASNVIYNDP